MKEIEQDELKKIQLQMLESVHEFCVENKISYYLYFGTLLGAIRHSGYIPWDDDIDIAMPRKDYEKFCKSFKSRNDRYKVIDCKNTSNYYLPFGKLIDTKTVLIENTRHKIDLGVYIDIFPLEELPEFDIHVKFLLKRINVLKSILDIKTISPSKKRSKLKNYILSFGNFVMAPISVNFLTKRINRLAQSYINIDGRYYGTLTTYAYGNKEIMKKSYFTNSKKVRFENKSFLVPEKYDSILKQLYGDYMKYPPIEKQITHHDFIAYWKE